MKSIFATKRQSGPEMTTELDEAVAPPFRLSDAMAKREPVVDADNLWEALRVDELLDAAKEGNLAEVRRLCEEADVDPDARGYMGWTAAHWAARQGHMDVLEYLHEIGANLDTLDRKGDCLLHKAAANGQAKACAWLLQHSFNVQAVNNNGMTPIDLVREKATTSRDATTVRCEALLVKECECTF
ncbi:Aste57867_23039 [Aphanomyces stellatus]|uniref:Aste57867_23039 protein n=1 Tax=Aphanomyces stellatus TaxID=120398 RepID=A0A485LMQ7_9STRA|nr:hypothetical protein As57867_022968 [Aphanomyces stellatus]VFT99687.1 Aste57867_23039 [Aphanomyces stellatus]